MPSRCHIAHRVRVWKTGCQESTVESTFMHISEKDLEVADDWLVTHGNFSIFITTFIPFFYSVSALVAGTPKMNPIIFFASSTTGSD